MQEEFKKGLKDFHVKSHSSTSLISTVRLGKMAQHARHWALFMAKVRGQSQNASNMALGKCIALQHIQISAS